MPSVVADLLIALQTLEITPSEFEDAVRFLRPAEAQIAAGALSTAWAYPRLRDDQRRRARDLCRTFRLSGLPRN